MNIIVIGKGLAGCGLMESLLNHPYCLRNRCRFIWIGPEMSDCNQKTWLPSSLNTTSLIALQGIEKNISPLGDMLFDAYQDTVEFIKRYNPEGVEKADRFHITKAKNVKKLEHRFGKIEPIQLLGKEFLGIKENSFLIEPDSFFQWWNLRIENLIKEKKHVLEKKIDLALKVDSHKKILKTSSEEVSFNKLFLATGAMGLDFPLTGKKFKVGKKAVGHYFKKNILKSDLPFQQSTVLSIAGHNLIFNKKENHFILGGSSEGEGPLSPSFLNLNKQKKSFLDFFPEWEQLLEFNIKNLYTGVRYKAPKRLPFVRKLEKDIGEVNGFYKNGWTLCHHLPTKLLDITM